MSIVPNICKRVKVLLRNPSERDDFIISHLEIVADDLSNRLQSFGLKYDTEVVILASVPAELSDLSTYQGIGQPLETLVQPKKIEWKGAGRSVQEYRSVPAVDELADSDAGTGIPGDEVQAVASVVISWEWRRGVLYISPCSQDVDLRIRFHGLPRLVGDDTADPAPRGAMNLLVYATAISIVIADGGPGSMRAKTWELTLQQTLADYQSNQVKDSQRVPLRLGGLRQGAVRGFMPPSTGGSISSGGGGGGGGGGTTGGLVLRKATLLGTQDGLNKTFLISPLPAAGSDPIIYSQGQTLKSPLSYSYFSGVVTFVTAPDVADVLDAAVSV